MRIEDHRTTCTIDEVSKENVGTYICKAVSDIGLAVTKAKLYVQEIPETKKKEILIRKAQERQEKIKKERVKIEKKREERRQRKSLVPVDVEETKPLGVTEVQAIERTEELVTKPIEKERAKPTLDIQQPLGTEAIASCKKIDEVLTSDIVQEKEKAQELLSPQEPMYSQEVQAEEGLANLPEIIPRPRKAQPQTQETTLVSEFADITEIKLEEIIERVEKIIRKSELKMAKEVTEMLEFIKVKEFGPGEQPLKEIAEIGYLVKNGISTKEITVLYNENKFPSLTTPQAQSALVNVVERKGHGPLISEVLTDETVDESVLAATVGFRALMKMVEESYVTIEEVITSFIPEDFIQRAWESTEVTEV